MAERYVIDIVVRSIDDNGETLEEIETHVLEHACADIEPLMDLAIDLHSILKSRFYRGIPKGELSVRNGEGTGGK